MDVKEIKPLESGLNADVKVPGSKSFANRALVISALAKGKSTLKNMVFCEDTLLMIEALKKLCVENLVNLTPHRLKVLLSYSHPPVLERIEAIRRMMDG